MKIYKNPDKQLAKEIYEKVRANSGFCPCSLEQTSETKCMCKEFRDQQESGFCHCKLYYKDLEEKI